MFEEPEIEKVSQPNQIIGIDLGIKEIVTTSDGVTYNNNKFIQKYEKRIKQQQRALARKEKGSNNYYKCRKKLAVLYRKLRNARKYYIHKITKEITDNYTIIATETLKITNMIKNKKLAKSITDVTWGELLRQLEYKSRWKGKQFYKIDPFYPSSQLCNICETKEAQVKDLKVREWRCSKCGNYHDRDINAAKNIMFEGLKQFMQTFA